MARGDIAMALHHGRLFSRSGRGLRVEISDVGLEDYRRGALHDRDLLVKLVRKHIRKHRKWTALLPPRVLFAGYFDGDCSRIQIKDALIAAGARDVVLLELAMAVALGHQESVSAPKKRTYLLRDKDIIQIFAVDDITIAASYVCELEMDFFQDSKSRETTVLGIAKISEQSAARIRDILADLKLKGFLNPGIYTWGDLGEPSFQTMLEEFTTACIPIQLDCAINGTARVASELNVLLKGLTKRS